MIRYSRRPFSCIEEMDQAIIDNWNAVVKPGDVVYHLGDFSFHRVERTSEIARSLKGRKFLVRGNHDGWSDAKLREFGFAGVAWDLKTVRVGDQRIVLCHYPMLTWDRAHYGTWQLHGHSHGTLRPDPHSLRCDVGVDPWAMRPVSFDEVAAHMRTKTFRPVDHHGTNPEAP